MPMEIRPISGQPGLFRQSLGGTHPSQLRLYKRWPNPGLRPLRPTGLREETVRRMQAAAGLGMTQPEICRAEALSARYVQRAKVKTALSRWASACPPNMIRTDWQHPALVSHSAQIEKVLAWRFQMRGLLVSGSTGKGKSRAMWSLMKRLAKEGREIRYYTASAWFSTLQGNVNYGRDEAAGWVNAVARAPIVFLDDLGQEAVATSKQEWCAGWFFQFLDIRLGHGLPLFITTNLTAPEMAGHNAVRANPMLRRLLEMCEVVKIL